MSLATALQETNELLRQSVAKPACRHNICHPDGPCNCGAVTRVNFGTTRHAEDVFPAAAMLALRDALKPIPESYFKIRLSDGSATVACHCRDALRMRPGFMDCRCGRTFAYTGRRVLVVKA